MSKEKKQSILDTVREINNKEALEKLKNDLQEIKELLSIGFSYKL